MDKVTLKTEDGVMIVGSWREAVPRRGAALLLHMMPADRGSYATLQESLAEKGISSLAIDLRGHGESNVSEKGMLDYRDFADGDHQASREDVETAMRWLADVTGLDDSGLAVVGASIGANLAISYAAAHPAVKRIVALSPGLDYRGITMMGPVKGLGRDQELLLVASREDKESADAVEKLAEVSLARTEPALFDGRAHGTDMFASEPGLMDKVVDWVTP